MQSLMNQLVTWFGGREIVSRRGDAVAWTGWSLVVAFGCLGWWTPQFCGLVCGLSMLAHVVTRHAKKQP